MARRKKSTRKPAPRRKKQKNNFSLGKIFTNKYFIQFVVLAVILGGVGYGLYHFFTTSKFFSVKQVYVNKDRDYSFAGGDKRLRTRYVGRNIFSINLGEVQGYIKRGYPELKKVEVVRALPDGLEVDIITREPAAYLDSRGGDIVIDKEGVVLTIGKRSNNIIRIRGINFFLNMPSRGEKIDKPVIKKALSLANVVEKRLSRYKKDVDYIDISDKNNLILVVYDVPVKLGVDDFTRKVDKLNQILRDPNIKIKDIKYIDLRFEEAVISPK